MTSNCVCLADACAKQGDWFIGCTVLVLQIVLVLPDAWRAGFVSDTESGRVWRDVALWFKQHFEESLGKNPGLSSFSFIVCVLFVNFMKNFSSSGCLLVVSAA